MRVRIVSGGQTGADRGALDAALELGAECGGWCPQDRAAEDGGIPARYPLRVSPGAGHAERTRHNVRDSDGTLVLKFAGRCDGTELSMRHAEKLGRPLLILDGGCVGAKEAAARVREFIMSNGIETLNVAGPRASGEPRAYTYAHAVIEAVLQS